MRTPCPYCKKSHNKPIKAIACEMKHKALVAAWQGDESKQCRSFRGLSSYYQSAAPDGRPVMMRTYLLREQRGDSVGGTCDT